MNGQNELGIGFLILFLAYIYFIIFAIKEEKKYKKILPEQDLITDMPEELPIECKKFSWGAFCLPLFWIIFNKAYRAKISIFLLIFCFIPYLGLIPRYFLGINGNKWAYKYKSWKSIGHFNRIQINWARVPGYGILLCLTLGFLCPFIATFLAN